MTGRKTITLPILHVCRVRCKKRNVEWNGMWDGIWNRPNIRNCVTMPTFRDIVYPV